MDASNVSEPGEAADLLDERHLHQDHRALAAYRRPEATKQPGHALVDDGRADAPPDARAMVAREDLDLDDLRVRRGNQRAPRWGGSEQRAARGEAIMGSVFSRSAARVRALHERARGLAGS